jgi:hypothetical protein
LDVLAGFGHKSQIAGRDPISRRAFQYVWWSCLIIRKLIIQKIGCGLDERPFAENLEQEPLVQRLNFANIYIIVNYFTGELFLRQLFNQ